MNSAITSHLYYEGNLILVYRANYKILQLALVAAGYEEGRFAVLEPACQTNLVVMEKRKAMWVQVYLNALAAGVDLETFPDINDCEMVVAEDAGLAGTAASLTTALAGANNDLVFTAKKPGSAGNLIQVQYVNPGSASQPLGVTVVGALIRVSLGTNGSSVITSTASQVMDSVSNSIAGSLVTVALAASNNGSGVMVALAATNLTGGSDV